jgi:hypothetical protein
MLKLSKTELLEPNLSARLELLEAALCALLRLHPVPDMARAEIRGAANGLLEQLDDAPNADRAAHIAAHCNQLCDALCG